MSEPTTEANTELREQVEQIRDKFAVYMKRLMGGRQVGGTELNENEMVDAILALIKKETDKAHYDINRLGTWVFIGDKAKLDNLDDLYWSYVMELVAENDPYAVSTGNYSLERIKKNMKYANFGGVGLIKMLARADQRAKERLAELASNNKENT
jgi:hypothetical protein